MSFNLTVVLVVGILMLPAVIATLAKMFRKQE